MIDLPGEAPTSLLSFFLSLLAKPWRVSLLVLAAASAETGLGPSAPREEAGDSEGAGLAAVPGGWGGGGMLAAPEVEAVGGVSGERLSLRVGLPDLVV